MTAMYELLLLRSRRGKRVQFVSRGEVFARLPLQWRNSEMYQQMKRVPEFIPGPALRSPLIPRPALLSPTLTSASLRATESVRAESCATPTAASFKSPRHATAGEPLASHDSNFGSGGQAMSPAPPKPARALPALLIKPPPDENRSFDSSALSGELFLNPTQQHKSRKLEFDSVSTSESLTQPSLRSESASLDSNQALSTKSAAGESEEELSEQFYQLLDVGSRGSSNPPVAPVPSIVNSDHRRCCLHQQAM